MAGRPTKLTAKVAGRIVNALRSVAYIETASAFAGVHKDTFYEWLKKGADGPRNTKAYRAFSEAIDAASAAAGDPAALELLEDLASNSPSACAAFSDAVEKAQAEGEMMALARISRAGTEHWQADAWRLERKFPKRWGRRLALAADLEEGEELDFSLKVKKPAPWQGPTETEEE